MNTVREFHDKAMQLAQLALLARHNGDLTEAEDLARRAYEFEAQAASLIPEEESSEPTRSIMYRSAASLAYQCKEYRVAQRLVAKGLSGYPSPQVEQELKDLLEQINFEHHLKARDIILETEEIQLSMRGNAVGFGDVLYSEFIKRIERTRKLVDRTVQRLMDRTFQRRGAVGKMYRPFTPILSAPREGSFIITLRLGRSEEAQQSPLFINARRLIDEILSGIEFIDAADEVGLRELIPQESYYQNFLSLTRDMAPDGDRISFVGFMTLDRAVSLTRKRTEIVLTPEPDDDDGDIEDKPKTVEGLLDYATSRTEEELVGITTLDGTQYNISVTEGMEDLVRSYYKQWVTVSGYYSGKRKLIYLRDIYSDDG